jgi:hypothetical protein
VVTNSILADVFNLHLDPRVFDSREREEHADTLEPLEPLEVDVDTVLLAMAYEGIRRDRTDDGERILLDEVPKTCAGRPKKRLDHDCSLAVRWPEVKRSALLAAVPSTNGGLVCPAATRSAIAPVVQRGRRAGLARGS